ncbi:hypothetical protein P886_1029 [Alteromonadaceae bacterium 2753L.S.0a.02]|nr:hypothetical protein P886_1029 [Alteromonadaceae bacterium 2753L.S.0a.02]
MFHLTLSTSKPLFGRQFLKEFDINTRLIHHQSNRFAAKPRRYWLYKIASEMSYKRVVLWRYQANLSLNIK